MQVVVQLELENLGVGKSRAEAAPVASIVRGRIDAVIRSNVQRAGTDLQRPGWLNWKIATDA